MKPSPCQTCWSRALLALALALGGCTRADELASADADADGSLSSAETSESGEASGEEESDTDTGTESESESGEDPSPSGIEDPAPPSASCEPGGASLLLDLGDAKDEATSALVSENVLLGDGNVPAIPLSPRAFLNRLDFGYPAVEDALLEVRGELWAAAAMEPEAPARYGLQYAVSAASWPELERPPLDLALIVDVGLAMDGEPLELAEGAIAALSSALQPDDRVSLIVAGEQPELLVVSELGLDPVPLTGLLGDYPLGSYADLGAALQLAAGSFAQQPGSQARVLLISNGHFVRDEQVGELVEDLASEEVFLSSLGVGDPAAYDNTRMRELAARGRGTSLFSRDPDQLAFELGERLEAHLMSAALELEVELSIPAGLQLRPPEGLPEQAQAAPRQAQLGPGESLVFHFVLDTCAPPAPDASLGVQLSWVDALDGQAQELSWERPLAELEPATSKAKKGSAAVAYARALQLYRDAPEPAAAYGPMLEAIARISEALELLPGDQELLEMLAVAAALEPA